MTGGSPIGARTAGGARRARAHPHGGPRPSRGSSGARAAGSRIDWLPGNAARTAPRVRPGTHARTRPPSPPGKTAARRARGRPNGLISPTRPTAAAISPAVVADEAGDAVLDDFRHRPGAVGDHRGTGRHRLGHRQPERFRPVDREEVGPRPAQQRVLLLARPPRRRTRRATDSRG